jgi:hypothetical protein
MQQEHQKTKEHRQHLAQLRQQLTTKQTTQLQKTTKKNTTSHFNLIKPNPHTDPTTSIRT